MAVTVIVKFNANYSFYEENEYPIELKTEFAVRIFVPSDANFVRFSNIHQTFGKRKKLWMKFHAQIQ